MSNTTPAPWQVDGSHVYGPDLARDLVCQVLTDHGRLVADRNLIAAAPEIYAALKKAVDDATGKPNAWFQDAKAALAKAEGSQ